MRTVEIRLQQPTDLSDGMAAMRVWLDERRFEPSGFRCHDSAIGVLMRVDFKVVSEAEAFADRFGGRVSEALAADAEQGLYLETSQRRLPPHRVVG